MVKKVVTVYIDDSSIRLLECRGNRVKRWAELALEPGLVKDGVVIEEAEVAIRVRQLLKESRIRARRVVAGLSGLLCLTRPVTLPQLPKAMLAEAVTREAKRLLPVPLEQVYISWQTIPAPEGKTQVFLVAVPRRNADALLKTLRQARLKPYIMGIKPIALARLVKEARAIIVDVQPAEFDIVIIAEGVPQPIRTVSFPAEALSWQEKLPLILDELERTTKFYNSNNPEEPLDSAVPLYVSGELSARPELGQSLSEGSGHPFLPLLSPLKSPRKLEFDPAGHMVSIGLALQEPSLGRRVANLNLLPETYRPKPISWGRAIALPGATATAGLLVPVVMLISGTSANIEATSDQLHNSSQILTERQLEKEQLKKSVAELEVRLAEAEVSRDAFVSALEGLDRQGNQIDRDLEVATDSLPQLLRLGSIDCTSNLLTISGWSPGEAEILSYARSLDGSGCFSQTIIASLRRGEDGGMTFTLVLTR